MYAAAVVLHPLSTLCLGVLLLVLVLLQVFDVLRCSQVASGRVVLSPGASLSWLAFSQEGQLAAMDRCGALWEKGKGGCSSLSEARLRRLRPIAGLCSASVPSTTTLVVASLWLENG